MSSSALAHRHGRRVHRHPSAGAHRHLYALRSSRPLVSASPDPAPRPAGPENRYPDHGHDLVHPHDHAHDHARDDDHHAAHHRHDHEHGGHGHSHGFTDPSIFRSRAGIRAVASSLVVLGATAAVQAVLFAVSGSVALLADLVHNAGDASTAIPLSIAFWLRSGRAERRAGFAVVAAIVVSACVALGEAVDRLVHPQTPGHLWLLAGAGVIGFVGNEIAAQIRLRAGRRLLSPALVADGRHARIDGLVSLAVVASAALVAVGARVGDPLVGLVIALVILRISWQSWTTVSRSRGAWDGDPPEAS